MKLFLNLIIGIMIYAIAVDIELNANAKPKELNYLVSIAVLPFLILAVYARTHISEFKKFLNNESDN